VATLPAPATSFVLCIDVEPRGRHLVTTGVQEWSGFITCIDYLTEWRERLRQGTGRQAHFCWLLRFDPQIEQVFGARDWTADRFRERIAGLEAAGDVFGLHHHAYRQAPDGRWQHDYTDPDYMRQGIYEGRDAFVSAMGYAPECCSIGAGWLDNDAVAALDEAGFKYDMTLTPDRPKHPAEDSDLGSFPSYVGAPTQPYRPSRGDFLKPGAGADRRGLWIMPASNSCGFHPGKRHPGAGSKHRMDALNLSLPTGFFVPHMEAQFAAQEPVVLCLLRTGDVSDPQFDTSMRANGQYLLDHARLSDIAFDAPAEAIRRYTARSRARRPLAAAAS
jgi:hypothetical protein